jgi:N-acetylglutamate synthase-like GNAT family acetyltransferase
MAVVQTIAAISAFPLTPAELPSMRAALIGAGLPIDDLDAPCLALFACVRNGRILGYGGLEVHGGVALARSIVVAPDHRGEGVGRRIVELLLAQAAELGARRIYLLTMDAETYFASLGFVAVDRRKAPAAILATRQMAALCPASATLMMKALTS